MDKKYIMISIPQTLKNVEIEELGVLIEVIIEDFLEKRRVIDKSSTEVYSNQLNQPINLIFN